MRTDKSSLEKLKDGDGPAEEDVPSLFVSHCPDCAYDLSTLPDGRCPECGLAFTHARLLRAWIARQAKVKSRRSAMRTASLVPFSVAAIITLFWLATATASTYFGFGMSITLLAALIGLFVYVRGDRLLTHSHELLCFVVPLFMLFFAIAGNPEPYPGMAVAAAAAVVICYFALRDSPLISGVLILGLGALPLTVYGLSMLLHGQLRVNGGHYWSDFDWPSFPRPRALKAPEAVVGGLWMLALSGVLAGVTIFFIRRALVRIRRAGRRPADTPREILKQARAFLNRRYDA